MKKGRRRKEDRSSMSRSSKNTPTTTCTSSIFGTGTTFSNSGSSLGFSFGAAQSPQTGGLFSTSTPFGFGQPPNTQNTGLLGGTPSTSLFGQPVLTGQTVASPFGTQDLTGASLFGGTSSTSPFGEPPNTQSTGLFGGTPSTSPFGQPVPNGQSTGLFGGTTSTCSFGQPPITQICFAEKSSNSGTIFKFSVVQGTDSMVNNGITTNISVKHQCITVMSNYNQKSLEELRIEDYEVQGRVKRPEKSFEFERAITVSKKYICSTHNEALKVYCRTDKCLICIYCQFYGNHVGHECELVTDIATTIREELGSVSEKLGDHLELIKKSRGKVINTKDSVLVTEKYLQDRIGKHIALLHAYMSKGETTLRRAVHDKTNQKIVFLDKQERAMSGIVDKCELAFSLIEKCQKNDSALVDEKPNIFSLVDEVSAFLEKRELEPAETDNLTCSFEYNLFDLLKTQIGGVKMLKPGQKESSVYSFHEHEMWGEGKTKDAEVQTEDPLESTAQETQDLMETADSGLAAQVWDNSPSDVNEKGDHDCSGDKNDNDDENEVGLRGVVEGETSFLVDPNLQISIDSQSSGEVISELLDEILEKVDRLAVADGVDDDSAKQVIETDD